MVAVSGRIVLDLAIAGGGTSAEGVAVTNWRPVAQSVLK